MQFPGDLTEEEREEAFQKLRAVAEEKLGNERAMAIEPSLREFAVSIERLQRLHFSRDDSPGFYLQRFKGPST